ncbi:MAG: hypothetical protein AAFV98_07715, partial [Chloroflexota bacterium]
HEQHTKTHAILQSDSVSTHGRTAMKKYYGLRMVSIFFLATSIIISISTVATIGAMWGMSIFGEADFNNIQALVTLIGGGMLALIFYAFGQLIDLQLTNYEASSKLIEQIEYANKLNNKTVQLLNKQLRIMHVEFDLEKEIDVREVEKQIQERREKLL